MAVQQNAHQLCKSSSFGYDLNEDLNKTFDLNKFDNHLKASDSLKTISEPLNKLTSGFVNKGRNVKFLEMESDESLDILPDLLSDDLTFDIDKTEFLLPKNVFTSEVEKNTQFLFSPASDSQFNKISSFLKNVSTPLPNFVHNRRRSSTPKSLSSDQLALNIVNIVEHDSSSHSLDEKEEPIAGSCQIKFQTDINFGDFENVNPPTSTHKTLSLPPVPLVLNKETDFKFVINSNKRPKLFENNLNVTQTFSSNNEKLFPCESEDSMQNTDSLNNTFKIARTNPSSIMDELKSNSWSEKENVNIIDYTYAIPADEIICKEDLKKTFLIDFNSVDEEGSPKSILKDITLNETKVLDSVEFPSMQQEQIANVTFTKELENDTQSSNDNQFYFNSEMAFKPMAKILEETYSENDLREMEVNMENIHQCLSASSEEYKPNTTFSKKVLPSKVPQSSYKETEKNTSKDQINLFKNENNPSCNIELFDSLQSPRDTFANNICKIADKETKMFYKSHPAQYGSLNEVVPSKVLNTTFGKEMENNSCFYNQIIVQENEKISANKTSNSDALQSVKNFNFPQRNEKTNQNAKFLRRHSLPDENSHKSSLKLSKGSKCLTISNRSEKSNFLKSSTSENSNFIENDAPISKIAFPLDLNQSDNCYNKNDSSPEIEDNVFTTNSLDGIVSSHLLSIEDCSPKIVLNSSNKCASIQFSEKTNQFQKATKQISTDNNLVHLSQNTLEDMSIGTFPEKTFQDERQLCSIPLEKDELLLSLNPSKEITNNLLIKPSDDIQTQCDVHLNENSGNSVVETTSSNLTDFRLKGTVSIKGAVKYNSLKSTSVESNSLIGGLIKPTNIVHPRIVSKQHPSHLHIAKPLCKPSVQKTPIASNINRTLILSDSSKDKYVSKDLNRKLSLPCLSSSQVSESKSGNNFNKPFEIPSKFGIKRHLSNYQKTRPPSKYSNTDIKNITSVAKQNLLPQPILISDKSSKISSISSGYREKQPVSSRLSVHENLKSFKMKESGSRANTNTSENGVTKIAINSKVIDMPLEDKKTDLKINVNLENKSRHSIASNLPKKFPTSLSNISNKSPISKLAVMKGKSSPALKQDSVNAADRKKLPKSSIAPPKFSLSKALPQSKSSGGSKSANDKLQSFGNQKLCARTQIRGFKREKDNKSESNHLDSSIGPTLSQQAVLLENTSNVKKSVVQCRFLPNPKVTKDRNQNLPDCVTQHPVLQNQARQSTTGRLPQLRRIPAPRINK